MAESILFLGDVFLDRVYAIECVLPGPVVFNLEHPISPRGFPVPDKVCLKTERCHIRETFGGAPLAVNLANNHIMDYGREAFEDTITHLIAEGIRYFGAGDRENNYNNPAIMELGGKRVGLFGYCDERTIQNFHPGPNNRPAPLVYEWIQKDLERFKGVVDRIVLNLHWGEENYHLPAPDIVRLARRLIDAGADALIGHHAHVIQPIEVYRDRLIAYCLGNFIFPEMDIAAHFDADGLPGKVYRKKMLTEEKASAGILLNVDTGSFTAETFFFDGNRVVVKRKRHHRRLHNSVLSKHKNYSMGYFKNARKLHLLRNRYERSFFRHVSR